MPLDPRFSYSMRSSADRTALAAHLHDWPIVESAGFLRFVRSPGMSYTAIPVGVLVLIVAARGTWSSALSLSVRIDNAIALFCLWLIGTAVTGFFRARRLWRWNRGLYAYSTETQRYLTDQAAWEEWLTSDPSWAMPLPANESIRLTIDPAIGYKRSSGVSSDA